MLLLTLICFVLVVRALQPLCLAKCWPYVFIRPCKDLKYSKSNWLLNSQLREPIMGSCQLQGGGTRILVLFLKEMKVCIVPVLVALCLRGYLKISAVFFCGQKYSIRGPREALFTSSYTHPLSNIHRSERSL